MSAVRRLYIDGRYGQLHLRIARPPAGVTPKRPLVCFHLSPGSGRMYTAFLEEMGNDRIAVAPDTPGFGESDPPPAPPTIHDYALAMIEVIDALGLEQVDLMGYHTGSKIAVETALTAPERVAHLVLVSAPIYTDEELARQRQTMGKPEPLAEDGSHLVRRWKAIYEWRGPGMTLEMVQREVAESLRGGERSWWGHRAAFDYHHADNLPKVEQPVLVLCPNDDLVEPTRRAAAYIRNGRLLELPEMGHGMLTLHAPAIAAIVRDFLDQER
ncbi:MAG: alpha/beta hydrolase [Chloroflexota bacterium]|nr:alpha/beta hydrolase [Dehalococcoidia bacterium]MDW8253456.1 alpha/beta hydrolase [Chloroflexota bacterium]